MFQFVISTGFDLSLLRFESSPSGGGFDLARTSGLANRAWPDVLFCLGTDLPDDAPRGRFEIKGYDVFK